MLKCSVTVEKRHKVNKQTQSVILLIISLLYPDKQVVVLIGAITNVGGLNSALWLQYTDGFHS